MDDEFDRIAASVEGREPTHGIVVSVGLLQKMVAAMKAKTATMDDLPPLPPYPVLPERSQDRVLWNAWAREYAMQAVMLERERCARIADEHASDAHEAPFKDYEDTHIDGYVDASNDIAAAIRQSK